MIVKENGLRYAKLIHVSVDNGKTGNSNKVYIMEELPDGQIKCDYGRVGKELTTEYKPKAKWDSVYKQKLSKAKGYTDVTEFIAEPTINDNGSKTLDISDADVKALMDDLIAFANKSIQKNYKVTQESVSEQQVKAAQDIINMMSSKLENWLIGTDIKELNDLLVKLYITIPRKMNDVRDHLFPEIKNNSNLKDAKALLNSEQDTLDTMAGQVELLKQQKAALDNNKKDNEEESQITILDQMGISIELETDAKQLKLIDKLLGDNKNRVSRIFKVINHKTQNIFDTHVDNSNVKKKQLYWHGSRNENWFNILQTGLLIRPSCAVHTGAMFGGGGYFANRSQKSLGYTSLSGSYWAKGNSNKGYLALFDVHVGNQKDIYKHDSSCYNLNYNDLQKEGYDSVYAHGGADLRNDEFIIYTTKQCTISYLIELK